MFHCLATTNSWQQVLARGLPYLHSKIFQSTPSVPQWVKYIYPTTSLSVFYPCFSLNTDQEFNVTNKDNYFHLDGWFVYIKWRWHTGFVNFCGLSAKISCVSVKLQHFLRKMSLVAPTDLELLTCSFCSKYLSVCPVTVFSDKKIKCGRASCTAPVKGTLSLYNLVADKVKFPCIYRYEGCQVLSNELELHEKEQHAESTGVECCFCETNLGKHFSLVLSAQNETSVFKHLNYYIIIIYTNYSSSPPEV